MVVIAIVAILAALLFPVAAKMQSASRRKACLSNMRQIGVALLQYAGENDGTFPETSHTTGARISRAWIFALRPYLKGFDEVRISPADPMGKERLAANGTSYVLNSYVFVPQVSPFGGVSESLNNVNRLVYPANTMLAFNVSDRQGASVINDHTHSDRWAGSWSNLCNDIQPDRHRSGEGKKDHSDGSANYLYADGHVQNIEAAEVKKKIESGVPFAKPPMTHEELLNL